MNRELAITDIQERFRQANRSFNELERRHWAAAEAIRLGRGGITIVSTALRISPNTIKRGMKELEALSATTTPTARVRKPGGGRKSGKSV